MEMGVSYKLGVCFYLHQPRSGGETSFVCYQCFEWLLWDTWLLIPFYLCAEYSKLWPHLCFCAVIQIPPCIFFKQQKRKFLKRQEKKSKKCLLISNTTAALDRTWVPAQHLSTETEPLAAGQSEGPIWRRAKWVSVEVLLWQQPFGSPILDLLAARPYSFAEVLLKSLVSSRCSELGLAEHRGAFCGPGEFSPLCARTEALLKCAAALCAWVAVTECTPEL